MRTSETRKAKGVKRGLAMLLSLAMIVSMVVAGIPSAAAAEEITLNKLSSDATTITVKTTATDLTQADFKLYHAVKDKDGHAERGDEINITALDDSGKNEGVYVITTAPRGNDTQLLAIENSSYAAGDLAVTAHNIIPLPVSYEGAEKHFTLDADTKVVVDTTNAAAKKVADQLAAALSASTGDNINVVNLTDGSASVTKSITLKLIGENDTLATVNGIALTKAELNKAATADSKGLIETVAEEAYQIVVTENKIEITAFDPEGLFRGMTTVLQLFPAEIESKTAVEDVVWSASCATIVDYPRYGFRSQQFDVARHFQSVEWMKNQIDVLSKYKMNVLKLHLTEAQGWRIAIDGYNELTEFGGMTKNGRYDAGRRGYAPGSLSDGQGGYYTQDDYKEILEYAHDHYMEVMPEIEFPGHATSQLNSLPALNAHQSGGAQLGTTGAAFVNDPHKNPFTDEYINAIMEQLVELDPDNKYLHMGGDEVYSMRAVDYVPMAQGVLETIKAQGKISLQWVQDNAHIHDYTDAAPDIMQNWKDSFDSWTYIEPAVTKGGSYIIANLSDHVYFDHAPYNVWPTSQIWAKGEQGTSVVNGMNSLITTPYSYSWDPIQASRKYDSSKKDAKNPIDAWTDMGVDNRIVGVEGCTWTELNGSETDFEIMLYPRVLGLAEVGWSPANYDRIINPDTNPPTTEADTEKLYWINYRERLSEKGGRLYLDGIDFMNDPDVWETKAISRYTAADKNTEDDCTTVSKTTNMNTKLEGQFFFEAADPADTAIVTVAAEPTQGTLALNTSTGEWSYAPKNNFVGNDGFTVAFSTPGYGIPVGMADGSANALTDPSNIWSSRRTDGYLGFAYVSIDVTKTGSEDISVKLNHKTSSYINLAVTLDTPVPEIAAKDFQLTDPEGNAIAIKTAVSYDNGSSYLLTTEPRAEGTDYTLTFAKDGYAVTPATCRNNSDNKAYLLSFDDNYATTEWGAGKYGDAAYTGHVPDPAYYTEGSTPGLGQVAGLPGNFNGLQAAGYSLKEWNTKSDGTGTSYTPGDPDFVMPGHDLKLYAIWEKKAATLNRVIYDANGATAGDIPVDPYSPYVAGTGAVVVKNLWNLQKPGCKFDGWNTKADGTGINYQPGSRVPVPNGGITLYADWAPAYQQYDGLGPWFTLTYNGNGQDRGEPPLDPAAYAKGAGRKATLKDNLAHLAKDGYEFNGWNTQADGNGTHYDVGDKVTVSADNVTLYAEWKAGTPAPKSEKDLAVYFAWGTPEALRGMPWDRLTTLNYAFWKIDPETMTAVHSLGDDEALFPVLEEMHEEYPDVTIVISVGGWADSGPFSDMAATKENRTKFINSCVAAMEQYPWLGGIDLDWEYPGIAREPYEMDGGCNVLGPGVDCKNYVELLKEMRAAFDEKWPAEHKHLTVCAAGNIKDLDTQDLYQVSQYVDRINFMTYDLHGGYWDKYAFHHSNVNAVAADGYRSSARNVVDYALKSGMDPQKINIGSPFYGKGWTLVEKGITDPTKVLGAPAVNGGWGRYDASDPNWHEYYDETAEEAFRWNSETGIFSSIENARSLSAKMDFINEENLGGIIVWSHSGDDAARDFPLLTLSSSELEINTDKYTVNYNVNGGTLVGTNVVKKGEVCEKPEEPTRSGYNFAGWYSDSGLKETYDFETPVTDNVHLYAKWAKKSTGGAIGGGSGSSETTKTETLEDGSKVTTVTKSNGDKTITVVDPEGKEIIKIDLPATIPTAKDRFDDVEEGHWADQAIHNMAGLKVVEGIGNNKFAPANGMTRGSLATVLYRLSNGKAETKAPFEDVAEGMYYTEAIAWAAKVGVVKGISKTEFAPDRTITRQELATMMARYAKLTGLDTKADAKALDRFNDGDETGTWAVDGVAWCVKVGILQGKGNDTLDPTANVTRAEVALMLDRFLGLLK